MTQETLKNRIYWYHTPKAQSDTATEIGQQNIKFLTGLSESSGKETEEMPMWNTGLTVIN